MADVADPDGLEIRVRLRIRCRRHREGMCFVIATFIAALAMPYCK